MAVYSMYFSGMAAVKFVKTNFNMNYNLPPDDEAAEKYVKQCAAAVGESTQSMVARIIKESPNDTFIFITTPTQKPSWNTWIRTYGLEPHIHFETPRAITNGNHNDMGRRLMIHILKGKTK